MASRSRRHRSRPSRTIFDAEVTVWRTRPLESVWPIVYFDGIVVHVRGANWLSCLTDLKNRGLEDIFVACVDGLAGFPEAIRAAYPQASVQLCIVHLVRATLRYVSHEDSQQVVADLKKIYQAATDLEAEDALDDFAQAWDEKYPTISRVWRQKWADIITLFDFPPAIRRAIYTTNAIESVNSVILKFTRNRQDLSQ